ATLLSLANQRLMRFRLPNPPKRGALPSAKIPARSQPSSQGRHFIAIGLVLRGLAKVRVSPANEHIVALNSRHHADALLGAAPDRHFHSEFDTWSRFAPFHLTPSPAEHR